MSSAWTGRGFLIGLLERESEVASLGEVVRDAAAGRARRSAPSLAPTRSCMKATHETKIGRLAHDSQPLIEAGQVGGAEPDPVGLDMQAEPSPPSENQSRTHTPASDR
jgi:hypothetical protein